MNITTATLNHPKVIKLKRRLGSDAVLSLFTLWAWAEQERPDGILSDLDEEDLTIVAGWDGDDRFFVTTLIELRLLDWNGECFALADLHSASGASGASAPPQREPYRSEQARNAANARWERGKSVASMLSVNPMLRSMDEHPSAYVDIDAPVRSIRSSSSTSCSTTTTPNPSSFTPTVGQEVAGDEGGGGGGESVESGTAREWDYPASLTPYERQQAETLVKSQGQAQELLDELAAAIQAGKIKTSPIAYLRALAKRAHEGTFKPEAGIKIALARARRRKTESAVRNAHAKAGQVRQEAAERPPIDKNAVREHIAALRAAMQMPRTETA